jgi:transmembrane sensor
MQTIDDQAAEWVILRTGRGLSDAEQRAFDAWYEADIRHKGAYLRAMAIDNALSRMTVQQNMRPAVGAESTLPARRSTWPVLALLGGIAAAVVLTVSTVLAPDPVRATEFVTAKGEMRQFPLADKSVATLNSASDVEFTLLPTARQVVLKRGEAWFQVAKDKQKPFVVEAGDVRVRAVGTAFSVRRLPQGAEVLVTEGVVEVWNRTGKNKRVLLSRGEQAVVPETGPDLKATRAPADIERKLAWRSGKVIFTNQTLGEAVADFNRYSPRKIVIGDPAIGRMTFIGQYAVDAPEVFAKDVSTYLGVPLMVTDETITIGEDKAAKAHEQGRTRR